MVIPPILKTLLSIKRPSGGRGVTNARHIIRSELERMQKHVTIDEAGNIICDNGFNNVLYSSHYDTVHWNEGTNEIRCDDFGIVTAWTYHGEIGQAFNKAKRDVLGADDAAGIFIMLQMIEADVRGTYIFHADEEIGCVGSRHIAKTPYSIIGHDLSDFNVAVAFDRKGTRDLIVNQLSENMASIEAADYLCKALNTGTILDYKPAKGLMTDTAMYADAVREVFNMSVGYYDEHTPSERLDLTFLLDLIVVLTTNPLLFELTPVTRELPTYADDPKEDLEEPAKDYTIVRPETIEHLCHLYPDAIAELLKTFGYDYSELFSVLNEQELI